MMTGERQQATSRPSNPPGTSAVLLAHQGLEHVHELVQRLRGRWRRPQPACFSNGCRGKRGLNNRWLTVLSWREGHRHATGDRGRWVGAPRAFHAMARCEIDKVPRSSVLCGARTALFIPSLGHGALRCTAIGAPGRASWPVNGIWSSRSILNDPASTASRSSPSR
jgi:hypothetical protein